MTSLRIKPSKSAAFHEAGHAVASIRVCKRIPPMVEIRGDGSGMTHGTGEALRLVGQYDVWDELIYAMAGIYAQARAMKQSPVVAHFRGGLNDYVGARPFVQWLVEHGFAESESAAFQRVHRETGYFIRKNWKAIERVATALLERRRLDANELTSLIDTGTVTP